MFSVTALAEDLMVGIKPSQQAQADGDLRAMLFWHRHTVTRLYEANRLVHPATSNAEIREFVGDLLERAPGGANLVEAYRRPTPAGASPIEQMYGNLRHLVVPARRRRGHAPCHAYTAARTLRERRGRVSSRHQQLRRTRAPLCALQLLTIRDLLSCTNLKTVLEAPGEA
jgi:hypothetical protein